MGWQPPTLGQNPYHTDLVEGNTADLAGNTNRVSTGVNSADAAVGDQDTTNGPYIKGNRTRT